MAVCMCVCVETLAVAKYRARARVQYLAESDFQLQFLETDKERSFARECCAAAAAAALRCAAAQ